MKLAIVDKEGKDTGKKAELKDSIFRIEPNDHAVYLDVKHYMANQRQGTHKTKERGEIRGSTAKIKRQKGTGTARAGSIKSPIMRGGGRTFGPRPRNYDSKLNKKVKQLARKSALSYKAKEKAIIVLEDMKFEEPKTKNLVDLNAALKISDKKSLFVLSEQNKNLYLSSRNLKSTEVVTATDINTYEIMRASTLVLFESSLNILDKIFTT
ncbi:MAG: 50S ribosomal protein L4 [Bacteroidales bacterium]|nr:50S ribosomal protein L4 [Bacteroidales bacterium]